MESWLIDAILNKHRPDKEAATEESSVVQIEMPSIEWIEYEEKRQREQTEPEEQQRGVAVIY